MPTKEERRAENDKRVADNIAKYGCHVVSVFDPDGEEPTFSYSIGIYARFEAPEAIVIGVKPDLGHAMVNEYCRQVQSGMRFERGVQYAGFLEGFNIYVEAAKQARALEYTFGCGRYYDHDDYPVAQLIYPTTAGIWPWRAGASDWFRSNQPMLGRKHPYRR